jgi:ribose transport system substrate-binding protein
MRRPLIATAAAVTVMLAVAACGGSSSSDSPSQAPASAAASQSASAAPAASGEGLAGAEAFLAAYNEPPTSLGIDTPLSRQPDTGKHIALLQTPEAVSKTKYDATTAAAEALGWDVTIIPLDGSPEGAAKGFQQAIDLGVDGIGVGGAPRALYEDQLTDAVSKGIIVVQDSTTDQPVNGVSAVLDGPSQVEEWGRMDAAWITADSAGTGNVLVFSVPEYPILGVWSKGVNEGLAEWCPDCTVTNIEISINDLVAGSVPQKVASEFTRNPDAKYAMFAFGGMATGVQAALDQVSIEGIKIGGETPDAPNIQALKDGTEHQWSGFPTQILGWRIADAFARAFNGDDMAPANDSLLPTQVLTQENIGAAPMDEASGVYVGYPEYEAAFKELWQLG